MKQWLLRNGTINHWKCWERCWMRECLGAAAWDWQCWIRSPNQLQGTQGWSLLAWKPRMRRLYCFWEQPREPQCWSLLCWHLLPWLLQYWNDHMIRWYTSHSFWSKKHILSLKRRLYFAQEAERITEIGDLQIHQRLHCSQLLYLKHQLTFKIM